MCAAEVEKDIGDLIKNVPALDDTFSIIDKIGAGNLYTVLYFSEHYDFRIDCIAADIDIL